MKRVRATRGWYDFEGVPGAAGPMQFFGILCASAAATLACTTFMYPPFTIWCFSTLIVAHVVSWRMRARGVALGTRLKAGLALALAMGAATIAIPALADAAYPPDMQSDADYALGGRLLYLALIGQCFASAPGILVFTLVPELATIAVFGQLNINVEMPACYLVYLLSASAMLAYANFIRRPAGTPATRRAVIPGARDVLFVVCALFVLLSLIAGAGAVVLRKYLPSPWARDWLSRYFFQVESREGRFDRFGNELNLRQSSGRLSDQVVLSVVAPRPVLLRRRVYDLYTGSGWVPATGGGSGWWYGGRQEVEARRVAGNPTLGEVLPQEITPWTVTPQSLPVAGVPSYIESPPGHQVWVDRNGISWVAGARRPGVTFRLIARECPSTIPALERLGADYPYWALAGPYLQVTPEVAGLRDLAARLTEGQDSVIGRARAIEAYLEREFIYNLDAPPLDPSEDAVVDFLTRRRQGICTDFASAMVILCRLSGIPARVVTGYAASIQDETSPGTFIARTRDAHAWAEVLIAGAGWVSFDPQPERQIEGHWWERARTELTTRARAAVAWIRTNGLVLALLAPVGYLVYYSVQWRGIVRRRSRRARAGRALAALLRALEPFAGWRLPGTAPLEHIAAARVALPTELADDVRACAERLLTLRYGRDAADPAALRAEVRMVGALRKQLKRVWRANRRTPAPQ